MGDTTSNIQATTQSLIGGGREIAVKAGQDYDVISSAQFSAGSTPSGLPEYSTERGGYVFPVGTRTPSKQVVITIDTLQLTDQARVKKLNQAIQRASRR